MDIRKFGCAKKTLDVNVPFHFYIHVAHQLACLIPHVLNSTKTDENASSTDFKDKISCLNPLSSELYHVCYSAIISTCGFLILKLNSFRVNIKRSHFLFFLYLT